MNKLLKTIILTFLILSSYYFGTLKCKKTKSEYNERCMKYFGNQGYPANYYCKLFVGEIKARDE